MQIQTSIFKKLTATKPWFALTTGYGIMHACFWKGQDSASPVDISIYTSLDYLNSIGASIVTQ